ncbi:MAG: Tex-like N-terminal domain-containing protein, partial [Candidatus Riflebacteria bacterium]|nr:Tex-like N-terminal domain-containing protein [Candidatus Riflebacteria bacterium]
MEDKYFARIAEELKIHPLQVMSTAQLLEEGGTVPFIARYRKERTGSLDEVKITTIRDRLEEFAEYDKRKDAIVKSLSERNLLTEELTAKIDASANIAQLEDIYLPYRPKKRTKATIAKEKGLEPLAISLLEQSPVMVPAKEAEKYISEEKGVKSTDDALQGARDIIAEGVSENADVRAFLRDYFALESVLVSKVVKDKETEGIKFKDYYDWQEPASKIAGHRLLAILRGENEGFLKVTLLPDPEKAIKSLYKFYRKDFCAAWEHVREAIDDSYKRLLSSSIENEYRKTLKEKAEEEAINVFAANLRELLMAAPLGEKAMLAIDPGYRTGCKVVC